MSLTCFTLLSSSNHTSTSPDTPTNTYRRVPVEDQNSPSWLIRVDRVTQKTTLTCIEHHVTFLNVHKVFKLLAIKNLIAYEWQYINIWKIWRYRYLHIQMEKWNIVQGEKCTNVKNYNTLITKRNAYRFIQFYNTKNKNFV